MIDSNLISFLRTHHNITLQMTAPKKMFNFQTTDNEQQRHQNERFLRRNQNRLI